MEFHRITEDLFGFSKENQHPRLICRSESHGEATVVRHPNTSDSKWEEIKARFRIIHPECKILFGLVERNNIKYGYYECTTHKDRLERTDDMSDDGWAMAVTGWQKIHKGLPRTVHDKKDILIARA